MSFPTVSTAIPPSGVIACYREKLDALVKASSNEAQALSILKNLQNRSPQPPLNFQLSMRVKALENMEINLSLIRRVKNVTSGFLNKEMQGILKEKITELHSSAGIPSDLSDEIRAAFPGCLYGPEEWATYLGEVEKKPLPEGILILLNQRCPINPGKKIGETHSLVLVPAAVNGQPLTLNSLGALVKSKGHFPSTKAGYGLMKFSKTTEYADRKIVSPYWALVIKEVLLKSRYGNYEQQQTLVRSLASASKLDYVVTRLLPIAVCAFMNYFFSKTFLFSNNPITLTVCREMVGDRQIAIGHFDRTGLCVLDVPSNKADSRLGVTAMIQFMDP